MSENPFYLPSSAKTPIPSSAEQYRESILHGRQLRAIQKAADTEKTFSLIYSVASIIGSVWDLTEVLTTGQCNFRCQGKVDLSTSWNGRLYPDETDAVLSNRLAANIRTVLMMPNQDLWLQVNGRHIKVCGDRREAKIGKLGVNNPAPLYCNIRHMGNGVFNVKWSVQFRKEMP